MHVDGALQGESTIPRRSRLNVLLATLVTAATTALLAWVTPLATSGGGPEEASPDPAAGADSEVYYPLPHGKADSLYYPLPHGKAVDSEAAGNEDR